MINVRLFSFHFLYKFKSFDFYWISNTNTIKCAQGISHFFFVLRSNNKHENHDNYFPSEDGKVIKNDIFHLIKKIAFCRLDKIVNVVFVINEKHYSGKTSFFLELILVLEWSCVNDINILTYVLPFSSHFLTFWRNIF